MPAQTPATSAQLNLGNRMGLVAKVTTIADGDTLSTGLSVIEHVSVTNGASGSTVGYTVSGGVITFAVAGGSLSNATILALGFA